MAMIFMLLNIHGKSHSLRIVEDETPPRRGGARAGLVRVISEE